MSRISNETAKQIAIKLTEKSRIAAEKLHVEYRELVTELYEEETPQEVKALFKKLPDWFYTRGYVNFNGHGFGWEQVSTTRQIICNGGTNANLHLTSKIADKITTSKRKWDKAKKNYEDLKDETKQALLALKTTNNIRKEIPLAAPMLPPPMSNALVCNFDSLKKKLSHQPEEKTIVNSKDTQRQI